MNSTPASGCTLAPPPAPAPPPDEHAAAEAAIRTADEDWAKSAADNNVDAVLVEFKNPAGLGTLPTSRPGMTLKTLAEGSRAAAYRATMASTFAEPAGTTHDFDQVVIALAPAQLSLTLPGKPAKSSWARGEAEFIARFLPHEAKNTGGKPVDIIVVAIK